MILDGYSQPGSSCNSSAVGINAVPLIEINGNSLAASGLIIFAGGSTVNGLIINRFAQDGIQLQTAGGNTIVGNFIGTDEQAQSFDRMAGAVSLSQAQATQSAQRRSATAT